MADNSPLTWMMWFEEDPKAIPQNTLGAAMAHFRQKYGQTPNRAQVPLAWPQDLQSAGLQIERRRNILPRHVHLAFDPNLQQEATTA